MVAYINLIQNLIVSFSIETIGCVCEFLHKSLWINLGLTEIITTSQPYTWGSEQVFGAVAGDFDGFSQISENRIYLGFLGIVLT